MVTKKGQTTPVVDAFVLCYEKKIAYFVGNIKLFP